MPALYTSLKPILFLVALYGLIAIWNTPNTIAARYVFEGLLLILLITARLDWQLFFSKSKLLLVFFAYLFLQIAFFSSDFTMALRSFKSEWMHFILFSVIGAGTGLALYQKKMESLFFYLGLAFATPLLIHIGLSIIKGISIGAVPWGYWGPNVHHADLGYAGLQASIFLTLFLLYQAKSTRAKVSTYGLLIVCIISTLIAQSRGGILFVVFSISLILTLHFFLRHKKNRIGLRQLIGVIALTLCAGLLIKAGISADPVRWGGMVSRALIGFHGDPASVYCNGIESLRSSIQGDGITLTPKIDAAIKSVEDGDGARIMAARSGLMVLMDHPMGINGSKEAYQMAITEFCGKPPAIFISHTHNGWIDTALAIGIPGALLLLLIMMNYCLAGYRARYLSIQANPYGIALFASAVIWILRGLLDSTLRDHTLESQAFVLAFLFSYVLSQKKYTRLQS